VKIRAISLAAAVLTLAGCQNAPAGRVGSAPATVVDARGRQFVLVRPETTAGTITDLALWQQAHDTGPGRPVYIRTANGLDFVQAGLL
jgi:hypothetical protein